MNIKKTADLLLNFAIKRLAEIFGIVVFLAGAMLFLALITYSPNDPNFIFPQNTKIENLMGFYGSFVSDLLFQSVGLIAYLIPITLIFTGINIFKRKEIFLLIENTFYIVVYSFFGSVFFSLFYLNTFTLYINGNGGFIGVYLDQTFFNSLIQTNQNIFYYILILIILSLFLISINFSPVKFLKFVKNLINLFSNNSSK